VFCPPLRAFTFGAAICTLISSVLGCAAVPGRRFAVESIEVSGNRSLDDEEIEGKIASRQSPRFLGLFPGVVYDYEVFDRYVLERDLQRIERYYRSRGFYWTRVRAGRVFNSGARRVSVEIVIDEGPEMLVGRVDIHGLAGLPAPLVAAAQRQVARALEVGDRLEEEQFEAAAVALQRVFADSGHAYVRVRRSADVDVTRHQASVGYWVDAGPAVRVGAINIKGLGSIPEEQVRLTLGLKEGEAYSLSDLEYAERALLDLGVFSSVSVRPRIEEKNGAPESELVPIDVELETSRFRSVHLGGGLQLDSQRTDLHLVAGWEDRNFLGGLRSFLIEFVPGAVIYPTRLPDLESPERILPQARLRLEFRQPNFLEAITYGVLRTQASISPVLLSSDREADAPVLGYRELKTSAGLERSLYWKLYGTLTHNIQYNDPFAYKGTLDPDLNAAVVSYPELFLRLDARNDRLAPTSGAYASATLQFAGVGGDARDVKLQPEARGYLPLGGRYTLAARGTVGLLFADNYGDTVVRNAFTGDGGPDRAAWVRDIQLMYLRGFFAGGPGSNRGYALREIGPHGAVPFYNPGQSSQDFSGTCDPTLAGGSGDLPTNCDLPLGGFSLWEASLELRFPLLGPLRGAVFADAADVSPSQLDFRLNRPHLSAGFGVRYMTPIGPVRFDVGYRVPGLQAPASRDEFRPDEIFGLPIALSFGIGEPF
jgi:outer membrane protein assembly factor BamA